MREIKFRGFHKCENGNTIIIINGEPVRGKWVYGYYFISERDIEDGFVWRDIPQIQQRYGDHYQYFDVIPETIGQYTGLHDKNGKEIYEGDIVEYKDFSNGMYLFKEQPKARGVIKIDNLLNGIYLKGMGTFEGNKAEIIGNIHTSPDILKEVSHEA